MVPVRGGERFARQGWVEDSSGGVMGVWRLRCPGCGAEGDLYVVAGSFSGRIPLGREGFAFLDAEWVDTEGQVVKCGVCGRWFPLEELDEDLVGCGGDGVAEA